MAYIIISTQSHSKQLKKSQDYEKMQMDAKVLIDYLRGYAEYTMWIAKCVLVQKAID